MNPSLFILFLSIFFTIIYSERVCLGREFEDKGLKSVKDYKHHDAMDSLIYFISQDYDYCPDNYKTNKEYDNHGVLDSLLYIFGVLPVIFNVVYEYCIGFLFQGIL